jgi:hypothetical protein
VSAPLRLTAAEVKAMSDFMAELTKLTAELGPVLEGYSGLMLKANQDTDHGLVIAWDQAASEYVIDDRSGD